MQRYLTGLRCTRCRTERPHTVTYLGNVFASATCTVCGETFRPRADVLIADYVRDFEHRIARKPGRMLDRGPPAPVLLRVPLPAARAGEQAARGAPGVGGARPDQPGRPPVGGDRAAHLSQGRGGAASGASGRRRCSTARPTRPAASTPIPVTTSASGRRRDERDAADQADHRHGGRPRGTPPERERAGVRDRVVGEHGRAGEADGVAQVGEQDQRERRRRPTASVARCGTRWRGWTAARPCGSSRSRAIASVVRPDAGQQREQRARRRDGGADLHDGGERPRSRRPR